MSNIFNRLKGKFALWQWKIDRYLLEHSPIYIDLNIWKCYKHYWRARKTFYPPYIVKNVLESEEDYLGSDYFLCETLYTDYVKNKWFYIRCTELGYKWKWNEFEFESVPHIAIKWKGKLYIYGIEAPLIEQYLNRKVRTNNDLYWEAIGSYLYKFDKNIIKTYNNNLWSRPLWDYKNEEGKMYNIPITILPILRPTKERETLIKAINDNIKEDN